MKCMLEAYMGRITNVSQSYQSSKADTVAEIYFSYTSESGIFCVHAKISFLRLKCLSPIDSQNVLRSGVFYSTFHDSFIGRS